MLETSSSLISICSLDHADVWKLTAPMALRNIEASEYLVYVPEAEVAAFEMITPEAYKILSQENLGREYLPALSAAVNSSGNGPRLGWYRQQFDKIAALLSSTQERSIIWDSDCVPLTRLGFFESSGRAIYMTASEHHIPYFEVIQNLLGLNRTVNQSFVIPGFPVYKSWTEEFINEIEDKHQRRWFDAIISCVDFSLKSGFSETETLGTWVAKNHGSEWVAADYNWERRGQSRFGYARSMSFSKLERIHQGHGIDILSFENWDHRRSVFDRVWRKLHPRKRKHSQ